MQTASLFPASAPVSSRTLLRLAELAKSPAAFAVAADLFRTLTAAGATGNEIETALDRLEKYGTDLSWFPSLDDIDDLQDRPLITAAFDLVMLRTVHDRLVRAGSINKTPEGDIKVDEKTVLTDADIRRLIEHALYFEAHRTTLSANLVDAATTFCQLIGRESPQLPPHPTVWELTADTDAETLDRIGKYFREAGLPYSKDKTAGTLYTADFTLSGFAAGKLLADIAASEPGISIKKSDKTYTDLPMQIASYAGNMPGICRAQKLRRDLNAEGIARPYRAWLSQRK